jgi:hypothetical protein
MKTHNKRLPKHVLQMSLYILRHQTRIAKYLKRFEKKFIKFCAEKCRLSGQPAYQSPVHTVQCTFLGPHNVY